MYFPICSCKGLQRSGINSPNSITPFQKNPSMVGKKILNAFHQIPHPSNTDLSSMIYISNEWKMKLILIFDYGKLENLTFQKIILEFFYRSFWDNFCLEFEVSDRIHFSFHWKMGLLGKNPSVFFMNTRCCREIKSQ